MRKNQTLDMILMAAGAVLLPGALAAVGVFLGKSALELCLMVRYQREM